MTSELINKKFGKLTVIELIKNKNGRISYKCLCDCGKEIFSTEFKLISGRNCSCGCSRNTLNDLIGKQFDKLLVTSIHKKYFYECRCNCGSKIIVNGYRLIRGQISSCGCDIKTNSYNMVGDHIIVSINGNDMFKIDTEDYEKIKTFNWTKNSEGYIVSVEKIDEEWKGIKLHRLVMNVTDSNIYIDHENHDLSDNRKMNLRVCNPSESSRNRKTPKNNKSSGIKGITWNKAGNAWIVRIGMNKNRLYLGSFENLKDAIHVRKEAELKYFEEFNYEKEKDVRFQNEI